MRCRQVRRREVRRGPMRRGAMRRGTMRRGAMRRRRRLQLQLLQLVGLLSHLLIIAHMFRSARHRSLLCRDGGLRDPQRGAV